MRLMIDMTRYFKFAGILPDVVQDARLNRFFLAAQLPDTSTPALQQQAKDKYTAQIGLDLPRIAYVSPRQSLDEVQRRLLETDHLQVISYSQGNFDARVITEVPLKSSTHYMQWISEAPTKQARTSLSQEISFVYTDD